MSEDVIAVINNRFDYIEKMLEEKIFPITQKSGEGEWVKSEEVEVSYSLQRLQAKINALADELELINRDDFYNSKYITIAGRLRQILVL